MGIVIAIAVGILVGYISATVINRLRTAGVLKVVTADEDGPYLFLELSQNVGDVSRSKYVTLRISNQYVNPQK